MRGVGCRMWDVECGRWVAGGVPWLRGGGLTCLSLICDTLLNTRGECDKLLFFHTL